MRGLGLTEAATPVEAEAALAAWADVAPPRQSAARESRSIEGIERDLAEFDRAVGALVARLAPDLAEPRGARRAAATVRAVEQGAADRRRAGATGKVGGAARSATPRRGRRAGRRSRRSSPRRATASARPTTPAWRWRSNAPRRDGAKREERTHSLRLLGEAGDGLSEAELRAEQPALDPTLLGDEIALLRTQRAELLQALSTAARAVRDAEAEYEALARGRDAAGAARQRMEARGELLDIAERWILRQGAARLAGRAIERHRAVAQDPLIARAGALFKLATDGAFAGLGTDYDDDDRPLLVAARDNGERVRVEALSEGTRDQLFLALRLALLERRAGEPLPFIGDDILASFDDRRTLLTLRLLADFGAARQAIVFTHHRHVADLASAAGADVVELAGA